MSYTEAFTHKRFYTQMLLHTHTLSHTNAFTHRRFYTQRLLHTDAFTHRRFYTQTLLHTDTFTHRSFYTHTHTHTHTHAFLLHTHTHTFTHRGFYTQTLTQRLLHTEAFTPTHAYTHLLRNILSNYWCGMHHTCTNNTVKLTGMLGRFEGRNLSEVLRVLMQLKSPNRLVHFQIRRFDTEVLGFSLFPSQKIAGTPDWSGLVSPPIPSVFVGSRLAMVLLPPAR